MRVPVEIYDAIILQTEVATAVRVGNDYAIAKLYNAKEHTWIWAAVGGRIEVIKWLHENHVERCIVWVMDVAGRNGHIDVVKWLHENRSEGCTEDAMNLAARNGHFKVVKWL